MTSPPKASLAKSFLLPFLIMVAVFLPKSAQTSTTARVQEEERVFENTLPKGVPLKVKIKKEKEESFKNVKNDKWVRELELEITNTGDKPIYYVYMLLRTNVDAGIGSLLEDVPGMRPGSRLYLTVYYGRSELGDLITKATPEDVPIKPGETYVFTIHHGEVGGWELAIRDAFHPQPTRIQLNFHWLSFGDGTGLGPSGNPFPPPRKQ